MALRRADARFLLPVPVRRAAATTGWRGSLQQAGVELVAADSADASFGSTDAPLSLLETRAAGRRYLALPAPERLELAVPVGDAAAAAYAFRTWARPQQRWKRARNAVLARLLEHGLTPPQTPVVTVVGDGRAPYFVRAAAERGVGNVTSFFATFGGGDELSRGAFHLFCDASETPTHVLKFARLPDYTAPFDRDARGLAAAALAPTARAPRLVARFDIDGIAASIETAAVGERMLGFLRSSRTHAAKLAAIERIAGWTVELARTTRVERIAADELARLATLDAQLAERIRDVPGTLVHGDLWAENVVLQGAAFTAIDWELARVAGPPLWDLWFFVSDALATLAGADDAAARANFLEALWRGRMDGSETLVRWTRTGADALSLDRSTLPALASLLWQDIGAHHGAQAEEWEALAAGSTGGVVPPTTRFAARWREDPGLAGWLA